MADLVHPAHTADLDQRHAAAARNVAQLADFARTQAAAVDDPARRWQAVALHHGHLHRTCPGCAVGVAAEAVRQLVVAQDQLEAVRRELAIAVGVIEVISQ